MYASNLLSQADPAAQLPTLNPAGLQAPPPPLRTAEVPLAAPSLILAAPAAPAQLLAAGAPFTPFNFGVDAPAAVADALLGAATGLSIDAASVAVNGAQGAISFYDGSLSALQIGAGMLITSGTTPGIANTQTDFGQDNGLAGDPDLDAVVNTVFATSSYDAASISFDFTVSDPNITGITFNLVFGSEEFPEWVDQFVDVAVVMVNGQNVALFSGDPMAPLSVIGSNLAAGYFQDNGDGHLPIEYDGVSGLLRIFAPVHQGLNTLKIAIGDTGDHILDSGLFISGLQGSTVDSGGVELEVPCTEGDDQLTGTQANELFDAKGGADIIDGGLGDDVILGGDGKDRLTGGDGKDFIDGGAGSNRLVGGAGDDVLVSAGRDQVQGGTGTDLLKLDLSGSRAAQALDFSTGADQVLANGKVISGMERVEFHGGVRGDVVTGGALNDVLDGGAGKDQLAGGGGDDRLAGGLGRDLLSGGAGADTYVYASLDDSNTTGGPDVIQDFARSEGDRIDLSGIDAIAGGLDDPFTWVEDKFTHHAGELLAAKQSAGVWLVQGDVNGDGVADFALDVHSTVQLSDSAFVL